jgi:glycosyltransferase involved in cell wall biosynthesis
MRVLLTGFSSPSWQSLERTRHFYKRALAETFEVYEQKIDDAWPYSKPDAIVSFFGSEAWMVKPHPDCPLVIALHGGATLNQEFLHQNLCHLETSDVILANCTSDISILRKMTGRFSPTIRLLPLPINRKVFQPNSREAARVYLPNIPIQSPLVLYVARLLPQKGLHYALRMVSEAEQCLGEKIYSLVVGDWWTDYPVLQFGCDYEQYIAELVRSMGSVDRTFFLPSCLSADALATCYAAADVVLHPTCSLDENFGYVPVEAMACGTPVIASAYGGMKDNIIPGVTGELMDTWTTPAGIRIDTISGAACLVRLLADREAQSRIGAAAAAHVMTEFVDAVCARMLVESVTEAIDARLNGPFYKVDAAPPASPPIVPGYLPDLPKPWSSYLNGVNHYVNRSVPKASSVQLIRAAGPISENEIDVVLDDPAWPSRYRMSLAQRALIADCASPVTPSALVTRGFSLNEIQTLLDIGALIATD